MMRPPVTLGVATVHPTSYSLALQAQCALTCHLWHPGCGERPPSLAHVHSSHSANIKCLSVPGDHRKVLVHSATGQCFLYLRTTGVPIHSATGQFPLLEPTVRIALQFTSSWAYDNSLRRTSAATR
jgi:hypothetical protein